MAEASLTDRIAQLSPEQAQRAALAVYDELPEAALAGDEKWPLEDLTVRARLLGQQAPEEVSAVIEELLGPGAGELKGRLAKAVLLELAARPATSDVVGDAVAACKQPDMLPIPLIIGAVLIFLALIKTKEETTTTIDPETGVQTTTTTVERQNIASVSQLTGNLNDFLSKLKGP